MLLQRYKIYIAHRSPNLPQNPPAALISYCCFFCALGPISLLKAKYDTSKLNSARIPTSKIKKSGMTAANPMNRPGVKYWYLSNKPPSAVAFARRVCAEVSRLSSICMALSNRASDSYWYCCCC